MSFGSSSGQSSNVSDRVGENVSMGGGSTASESYSSSIDYGSDVWGPQQPYLKDIYQRAQGQSGDNTNLDYARSMLALGEKGILDFMTPQENPMFDIYSRQLQENLTENILPAIGSQAGGLNQRGGGRHGVAEGVATAKVGQQLQDFAGELYGQDRDRMLQAMEGIPVMANFGLGIPWFNLNQYAGLLGRPAMQDLGGESESYSSGSGSTYNQSYGYDVGHGEGGSSNSGFNIGIPVF